MGLTMTVLGCSGSYPGPGQAASGYLVRDGDTSVWIDCGPGTLANLQRHVALDDLTAIVVSHAHVDHWSDLPSVHVALRYFFNRRDVPVYGTVETRERVTVARGDELRPTFAWTDITDGSQFAIGGLQFTCARTDHPVETLAMRVEDGEGRSLVYTADTGKAWPVASLATGADLLLCEAGADRDEPDGVPHLTPSQAGAAARAADVATFVMTHLPPGADREACRRDAEDAFGASVEVAMTDATFVV